MNLETYHLRQAKLSENAGSKIIGLLGSPADYHCDLVRAKIGAVGLNDQQFLESIPAADPSFAAVLDPMRVETAPPSFGQSFSDFAIGENSDLTQIETIADGSIRQIEIGGETFVFCFSSYWQRESNSKLAQKHIIGTIAAANKIPVIKEIPKIFLENVNTRDLTEVRMEVRTPINSFPYLSGFNNLKYGLESMFIYRRRVFCYWQKTSQIPNYLVDGEGGQDLRQVAQITVSAPFSPKLEE